MRDQSAKQALLLYQFGVARGPASIPNLIAIATGKVSAEYWNAMKPLNQGQSETIAILREEIVKRDKRISFLESALHRGWNDLNELRHDAHEAETRLFDAIEGKMSCQKTNDAEAVESCVGIISVETAIGDEPHLEKKFEKFDNN